ncbi:hypothetical protein ACL6C3_17745 [Capilliphycus salinus ALCB114379]|uniref:hypothetical protein n=1 Tax=Capilliphycus salinus TaxID=2768948 RepID=UPI0039A6B7FD
MASTTIGFRIPDHLHRRLEEYRRKARLSKSEVIVSAIAQYLGAVEDVPFSQRVIDLEERVMTLEAELLKIKENIHL